MASATCRVINEDRVQPGRGFGTHPHRDMEIVTYVLEGALEHKDSHGQRQHHPPGRGAADERRDGRVPQRVQRLQDRRRALPPDLAAAGQRGIAPGYEQKRFDPATRRGALRLVASPDGAEGSVTVHTDARLYAALLEDGERATHTLRRGVTPGCTWRAARWR
jgi:redox-sensitive bicupin YhaK (pirin superfamily)